MTAPRFHRLRTWLGLAFGWLVLAALVALYLPPPFSYWAVVPFWVAVWFFAVWTIGVGVRVGLGRAR